MVIFAMKKLAPVSNARYSLNAVLPTLTLMVFLSAMVLSAGGCAGVITTGKNFDMRRVSEIKKGVTTKNDILTMFGKPYSKSQSTIGESWMYQYSKSSFGIFDGYKMFLGGVNATQPYQMLAITFKGDIVQEYQTSESGQ